jgi:hypothetical protein
MNTTTPEPGKVVEVTTIPDCNFCSDGTPGPYDFRTTLGGWANGCEAHWVEYRAHDELGVGHGQLLIARKTEQAKVDSDEFMRLVDDAWFAQMQGDLMLERGAGDIPVDEDTRALVVHMAGQMRANLEMTAGALDQYDANGDVIDEQLGDITDEEQARRIARALAVMFYGGS